jgi:hypothetical protein
MIILAKYSNCPMGITGEMLIMIRYENVKNW